MYTFNHSLKRLEPTGSSCQYCETGHSSHMEDNFFVPLYKEQDRTNIIVYRSVKYQKIPVGIPRCRSCKEIHEKAATQASLIAVGLAIAVEVICFKIDLLWGFIGLFPSLFILFGGAAYFQNKFVEDKGITTKMNGAKQNEAVQDLVISGWSFTMPSA
ncbi:hypothetical protein [Chitinophaga sp.]|uniref:hypothetical protein n=1 Tax=Chitinophaga sp. TaxID=1869181 RepID=UPI0031DFDE3C